ncbi:ELM1/GtrOC1 family putative glycosyltransferase [uncultured Desulfuromonas sp.]|uniref:ELM1/GtrOC1 family putative glycosyltransferase n=1 Tax=uncultured Desulfuromonas sp. TaxID=181013 RepID=UPI002AABC93B|nr:ELM1/GtrOC1 family putative glycosyltransferase [uncultured Desulfuromonas sp.]
MSLQPELLELLACPQCKQPVEMSGDDAVQCRSCHRSFPVRDGIPVMLVYRDDRKHPETAPRENLLPGTGPLLILNDGKPGHVNQSLAFAQLLNRDYRLLEVGFKYRTSKGFSYVADRLGFYSPRLFMADLPTGHYDAVVSAGSETYYANRTLSRCLGCKSIAIMMPKSYRLDFDLIVAQQHDNPPPKPNIVSVPINLSFSQPQGVVTPEDNERYIALIIGGDSAQQKLDVELLRRQIEKIMQLFPGHRVWLTTSRRTPTSAEEMLRSYAFSDPIWYSENPVNPISDFLHCAEYVFVTADSSSMISEAVSFGNACVEVLPLSVHMPRRGKFIRLLSRLEEMDCLHVFDGSCRCCQKKVDLCFILNKTK